MNSSVAVVGAGVIGLSAAIRLLESGFKAVTIIAEQVHPHITSSVAGAIWMPYKVEPEHNVMQWAKPSLTRYQQLADSTKFGIRWLTTLEMYQEKTNKEAWMDLLPATTVPVNAIIPADCQSYFSFDTLFIDTSVYLPQLQHHFLQLGGNIQRRKINSLNELHDYSIVINCTGIGAHHLVNDEQLYPMRGQLLKFTKPHDLDFGVIYTTKNDFTHVFPRQNDCVIGGTLEEHEWDTTPDVVKTQQILARALKLVPQLAQEKMLAQVVGLRPARSAVRLEKTSTPLKQIVIHNYGHGGAGVTLAWGCAENVLQLLG